MSGRGAERHPAVAFQGELGAFSEEALLRHFGGRARPLPCRDFQGVGEAVASGEADYGILPVENSVVGSVQGANDVLAAGEMTVVAEVTLPIRHYLLGISGASEEGVRRVLSHPVALAQCTRYLRGRTEVEAVAVYDTAGAARQVARLGDPAVAAVAPEGAARRYGLSVLAMDLQDRDDNQTRFYLLRPAQAPPPAHPPDPEVEHRTVVVLELGDAPGALVRVLDPFARRGINLSRIESRPTPTPWRYRFLLELCTHAADPAAAGALEEAGRHTAELRVLGSFPMQPSAAERGRQRG